MFKFRRYKLLGYWILLVIASFLLADFSEAFTNSIEFEDVLRDEEGQLINDDRDVSFNIFSKSGQLREWNYNRMIRFDKGRFNVSIPKAYFDGNHNLVVTASKGGTTVRTQFPLPKDLAIPKYLLILFGAIFIFIFAMLKFNTWPEDASAAYDLPPRHFTTFRRYFIYAIAYSFFVEALFCIIVFAPDFFISLNLSFGGPQDKSIIDSIEKNSVLWAVFLLTGVLPNFPWINRIELSIRKALHRMAFIPNQAKSAILEFTKDVYTFRAEPDVVDKIIAENEGKFDKFHFLKQDGSFLHKWSKINYLLDRIQSWDRNVGHNVMVGTKPLVTQAFLTSFEQLKKDIEIFRSLPQSEAKDPIVYADWLETRINESVDRFLKEIYTYISCNILSTEKIPQNRLESYKYFGLYPKYSEKVYLDLDTIIYAIFFILLSILIPCVLSMTLKNYFELQSDLLKTGPDIVRWIVYGVLMHGLTILFVSLMLQYLYKNRFVAHTNRITVRTISSIIGYFVGFIIIGAGQYLKEPGGEIFREPTFLWPMITAITGFFIAYHIDTTIPKKRLPLHSAILQGVVTSSSVIFICFLINNQDLIFYNTSVLISFFVGFSIGYIHPLGHRNRESIIFEVQGCGRSMHRFECVLPIKIVDEDTEISCQTVDINVNALRIDTKLELAENKRCNIIFNSSLSATGVLFKKIKNNSIIKLRYNDKRVGQDIQALIDRTITAYA